MSGMAGGGGGGGSSAASMLRVDPVLEGGGGGAGGSGGSSGGGGGGVAPGGVPSIASLLSADGGEAVDAAAGTVQVRTTASHSLVRRSDVGATASRRRLAPRVSSSVTSLLGAAAAELAGGGGAATASPVAAAGAPAGAAAAAPPPPKVEAIDELCASTGLATATFGAANRSGAPPHARVPASSSSSAAVAIGARRSRCDSPRDETEAVLPAASRATSTGAAQEAMMTRSHHEASGDVGHRARVAASGL